MKILYSLAHPSHLLSTVTSGHAIRASALLNALTTLGVDVVIDQAASDGSQVAVGTYRQLIKKVVPRPLALHLRDQARVQFSKAYGERLIDIVRQEQPDVILQTYMALNLSGKIVTEATGVPLVLDDTAPLSRNRQSYKVSDETRAREIHTALTHAATLCVAVNEPIRRSLAEEGIPPEKLIKIPNGIRGELFNPRVDGSIVRAKCGFAINTIVIIFVGFFQVYHRLDMLLHAFQQLEVSQDVRLLLVGEGKAYDATVDLAHKIGIHDRIIFTGQIAHEDVPHYIAAADIAVLPAHKPYGNPVKLYEYMALGKAVIAPNDETVTEIGTHGRNLMTFEAGNILALEQALTTLIEDASVRQHLGIVAAHTIAEEHTWLQRATTLIHAFETML